LLEQMLGLVPEQVDALYLLAITEQSEGHPEQAISLYRRLLAKSPVHAGGHYNLALLLSQQGQHSAALRSHDSAVRLLPMEPWAWINRGNSKAALRDFTAAIADYERALALHATHPEALLNKGHALHELGQWEAALACHDSALASSPGHGGCWLGKARALVALRRFEDGLSVTDTVLRQIPEQAAAWCVRGLCLSGVEQHIEALEAFRRALAQDAGHAQSWCGQGQAFDALNRAQEAEQSYLQAIELQEDYVDAWVNLGVCLHGQDRHSESLAALERALSLAPSDAWCRWNLGLALLRQHRFAQAWLHFDSRWEVPDLDLQEVRTTRPAWEGSAAQQPLLLWGEQGIGDQILYASILPELAQLPQKKYVALDQRLIPLFARSLPGFEFVDLATVSDALDFAEHLPLGSLPRLFRPDLASFTRARHPYLQADPERSAGLRHMIAREGKLICGVSWSSNRKSIGRQKSLGLAQMLQPLASSRLHFVDLQYGDTSAERQALQQGYGIEVQRLEEVDNFQDIDGLAALIQACDVVITTSNSTAHLAGALGKTTLLLLPSGKGQLWYWAEINGTIPWYPSIQAFRQNKVGNWEKPLQAIKAALETGSWN
jgi:tetratricopeptide (TPR) repeat protein